MSSQNENQRDTYTHGHHESVLRSHSWRTAENSAGYLLPHLVAGHSLLDVGCGPGTITLDLAERVAPGEVIGIDLSTDVISTAESNRRATGAANVTFRTGDVYALEYSDDSFDVVHAHQVLQHLSDPVLALTEMRRVCVRGGAVAIRDADYGGMFWSGGDEQLDRWLELYRSVARRNGAEPDAARHLLQWAAEAGFDDVTSSADTWVFATPELRSWWGSLWAERTVSSAFGAQAVEYGLADHAELSEIAAGWRSWSEDPNGWFAVVNGEMVCRS